MVLRQHLEALEPLLQTQHTHISKNISLCERDVCVVCEYVCECVYDREREVGEGRSDLGPQAGLKVGLHVCHSHPILRPFGSTAARYHRAQIQIHHLTDEEAIKK